MQENNKSHWSTPLLFAFILLVGIAIGLFVKGGFSWTNISWKSQNPMEEMMQIVKSKYVDTLVNDSASIKLADYYLAQLDPHSVYIPPSDLNEVNDQLAANLTGIGIEFQQFKDSFYVTYVIPEGPAFKGGLQVGDILWKVDDSVTLSGTPINADEVRKKVKGIAKSSLQLSIIRNRQVKKLNLTRANVPLSPIDAFYMLNDTTGYIRLNKFTDRTYEAFMQSLDALIQKGMKSLVFDLRNNGGGLLSEAVAIADDLLSGNKLIVYTQGAHSPRVDYYSKREGLFEKGTLTILMNESSASASEVLAGALQDWDRATIVGTRSFGKGLVQQQFNLSNGGALRLTTAKYYSPLGRNIQRSYEKGKTAYEDDYVIRVHEDAMGKQDSNFKGEAFKTPKGKVVYGGGGIYPDKWVATPNVLWDSSFTFIGNQNFLNEFVFKFYQSHWIEMQKMKNPKEVIDAYQKEITWKAFIQFIQSRSSFKKTFSADQQRYLTQQILASLARMKWYKNGYFEVYNQMDPTFAKMIQ